MHPLDWDARVYGRVADPQEAWARDIIARLELSGTETVLDAGCGSGRVTRLLLDALPHGHVIGVDATPAMLAHARELLVDPRVQFQLQDLTELSVTAPVDAVFSCAVFHHIHNHRRLFGALRGAMRTGARLQAQCGGYGNIERFRILAEDVSARAPFAPYLSDMPAPWHYATTQDTEALLTEAGFGDVRCWYEDRPTTPAEPRAFAESVLLNYHLAHLRRRVPGEHCQQLGSELVDAVMAEWGPQCELMYIRLNIAATAV